jgi:hypothetical protein
MLTLYVSPSCPDSFRLPEHHRTESAFGREAFAPMASEGRNVR